MLIQGDSDDAQDGLEQRKLQDFTNVLNNFVGVLEENKLPEITTKAEGVQIVEKLDHIKTLLSPIEDGPDIYEEKKEELVMSDSESDDLSFDPVRAAVNIQ